MAETANNTDSMPVEEWRDIPGWEGYQASSLGRIRSVDRVRMQRQYGTLAPVLYKGKVRAASQCPKTRYIKVGLTQPGKRKRTMAVNVLVCLAFHGPRPDDHDAAHWNGDRTDNRPENLRWATRSDNLADRGRHGTINHGERNGQAKLTAEQVRKIRRAHANGKTPTALSLQYDLNPRHVCDIVAGRRWGHVE